MALMYPVRVVVIDDHSDHLFAIANALSQSGIPCVWHLYDKEAHQLVPPAPVGGYTDIRLVITDLNIRDASTANPDPKTLAGTLLSEVLLPVLPASQAPYGLVLWSSVQGVVDDVRAALLERIDSDRLPIADRRSKPLSIQLMKKGDFVSKLGTGTEIVASETLISEAARGSTEVRKQLEAALADPQLQLVCAWETRVSKAASATVNEIYAAAVLHASRTNRDHTSALKDILVRISNEAAGFNSAAADPVRALDDGLIDLFVDDLRSVDDDQAYLQLVNASLGAGLGKKVDVSSEVRHQLNTAMHVETKISNSSDRISRGLVLGSEDQVKIANKLGYRTPKAMIWEEFLFPISQFENAANDARGSGQGEDLEKKYETAKGLKNSVLDQCYLRLLEIGADCDHANKRKRTVRLLCALEIPEEYAVFIESPCDKRKMKNDSLMKWGPWNIDNRKGVFLLVSVRRFTIQQEWPLPADLKPKYRLRRPLVDMVLREYANHSSRLGYVAIT